MISGGMGSMQSVEVISKTGKTSCTLPQLPSERIFHTHDNNLICGGGYTENTTRSCIKLTSSGWVYSHVLEQGRRGHSSWDVGTGTILLGGWLHPTTTEIANLNGTTQDWFTLKYDTA